MTGPDDASDDVRNPAAGDPALDDPAFDDSAFDDPSFDEVRGLLADARVTGPIPAPVAARLDETLASLQAERGRPESGPSERVVVPLRRRFAPMIAAAAAVVVVAAGGFGIARLAQDRSSQNSSASADTAGGSASSVVPAPPLSGAKSAAPSTGSVPAPQAPAIAGEEALALPRLQSTAFAQDAAQVMRSLAADSAGASPSQLDSAQAATPQDTSGSLQAPPVTASPRRNAYDTRAVTACTGPAVPDAVVLPARLDGALVALVFRPPTATAQQVEAWSCDGATRLAEASVPR